MICLESNDIKPNTLFTDTYVCTKIAMVGNNTCVLGGEKRCTENCEATFNNTSNAVFLGRVIKLYTFHILFELYVLFTYKIYLKE